MPFSDKSGVEIGINGKHFGIKILRLKYYNIYPMM